MLTEQDLSNNNIGEIPPFIKCFILLRVLDIHANCLLSIPPEIGALSNLRELYIHNSITENVNDDWLSFFFHARRDHHTDITQVRNNKLDTLPPEIGKCTELRMIDVTYNWITHLPPEIGKLVNLRSLKLSYNKLRFLPAEIGGLSNLMYR